MELPNKLRAHVPLEKITDYLLSETHAVGKAKARFFRSHGFGVENVSELVDELIAVARNGQVEVSAKSQYGTKYVIDGEMKTPNGVMIQVRTVWIVENRQEIPRFVTAYPIE